MGGAVDLSRKLFVLPAACLAGAGTPQREETDGLGWGEGKERGAVTLRLGGGEHVGTPPEGRGRGRTGCSLWAWDVLFSKVI